MERRSFFKKLLIITTIILFPHTVYSMQGYCKGHEDGHKAYHKTTGRGDPGYRGCPGDPGSPGGSATPYERGFKDGMMREARKNN